MGWTLEDQGGGIKAWELQKGPFIAVAVDGNNSLSGKPSVALYTERNWKQETGNHPLREEGAASITSAKEKGAKWLREKKTKEELAAGANSAGKLSRRRGAPGLSAKSPRADVVRWLQWNDPNGSHTDAQARREGGAPYTAAGAWDALEATLEDL